MSAFITRMYVNVLERTPSDSEVNEWVEKLESGKANGSDVAIGFELSKEYINQLYKTLFDRSASDKESSYWREKLDGGDSRAAVLQGFLGSNEFQNLCISYGIAVGDQRNEQRTGNGRFCKKHRV